MDKRELDLIAELMEALQGEMEYSEDDISERLGKKKPEIEVVKMEMGKPMGEMSEGSMDMDEEDEDMPTMGMGDEEEDLKERLMKLRG